MERWFLLGGLLASLTALQGALLPHAPLIPTAAELGQLARVRALLATSTPERPNPVRIVFYGQSITLEPWWVKVATELRRLYPHARLNIENKAIAGFQDWALARAVVADLVPMQPDLVILHAYGSGIGTDLLLGELRSLTTTEVLLQTDHVHGFDALDEETDPANLVPTDLLPYRNYVALPAAARNHGACLARIRKAWKAYLQSNGLTAEALLSDASVHLNEDGDNLLAEFVLAYLQPGAWAAPVDPWDGPRVKTAEVGRDLQWRDGVLECDFTGTMVKLVLSAPLPSGLEVWVDDVRPDTLPELYGFSRTSASHFNGWPALSRVGSEAPLQLERWFLAPSHMSADGLHFGFRVWGSLTGPDGEGTNTARFVSDSGRVVIEPGDHWIGRAVTFGKQPVPDGYMTWWDVQPRFTSHLAAGTDVSPQQGRMVTLFQGLADGPHRLRLVALDGRGGGVGAVRAFSPQGRAAVTVSRPRSPGSLSILTGLDGPTVIWTLAQENDRSTWRLEFSPEFGQRAVWQPIPTRAILTADGMLATPLGRSLPPGFFRLARMPISPPP